MRGTILLIGCITLAMVGCQNGVENDSISSGLESRKSKSSSSSKSIHSSAVVEAIQNETSRNLERLAAKSLPDSGPKLMKTLSRLEIEQLREADATKLVLIQKRRVLASDRLLKLETNMEQRREAVRIHLHALTSLSQFGDPAATAQFEAFAQQWQSSTDPVISRTVDLARVTFNYSAQRRRRQPEMTQLINSISELANRFPNEPSVFNQLTRLSQDTLQQGDTESWLQMTQTLVAVYGSSDQLGLRNAAAKLQKQMDVSGSNLQQIAANIASGDVAAVAEMRIALEVLLDSELTTENLQLICRTLLWLEHNASVQQAEQANEIAADLSRSSKPNQLQTMLQRNCSLRKTRLNLIGKPFSITVNSARGGRLSWNTVSNNRRTMVVFWSADDPGSVRFVKHLAQLYENHRGQDVQLVAVNVTRDAKAAAVFGNQLPTWEIAMAANDRASIALNASTSSFTQPDPLLLEKYGIETLPQLITVDQIGNVAQVNPEHSELERFLRDENK